MSSLISGIRKGDMNLIPVVIHVHAFWIRLDFQLHPTEPVNCITSHIPALKEVKSQQT
jgi:hypothetical protein